MVIFDRFDLHTRVERFMGDINFNGERELGGMWKNCSRAGEEFFKAILGIENL